MRFWFKTLFFVMFAATASAQSIVPDRVVRPVPNTDFPGNDLQSIFDTTYEACRNACMADLKCNGLTFNQKSNACFLKSELGEGAYFEGAYSARVTNNDPKTIQRANERMADLTFLSSSDVDQASTLASGIAERFSAGDWTLEDLLSSSTSESAKGNWSDAITYSGAALTLSDRGDLWAEFARVVLGYLETGRTESASVYDAQFASINAYLRAENNGARVTALVLMSSALERNGRYQDMIEALRIGQAISPREDVETALDRAIRLYGFGIRENTVESDLASPRLCAQFSEPLLAAASEYQSYVRLEGVDPVLSVSGTQLCVEGLKHGQRYTATFRQGLPAASGETLAKDVELKVYVRDRSPQVSFPGRGYILPAMGEVNLPITGVNTPEVELILSRMSDRNLIRAIQNSYFAQPLDYYSADYVNSEMATEVWRGTGVLKTDLNQDVTTLLPLGGEIGALQPGVYVLQASIPGKDPYDFPPATQWFVSSDLGLMTMDGNDGLHVIVRSLQTADAKAGINVDLISQANEVLASATTDDQGHVVFDAALTHGTGGAAPAMVMAAVGEDDFSFLPLTDPEFDLSDRGVEGRAPAGPVDVFMTTDRGAYRAGETIYVTALARDPEVKALSGVPLTAVLYRPDGQEYSRQLSAGDKEGGNVFALPVAGSAPRGSWRISVYTDPDSEALASTSVLVEDFLPQRIDFELALPDGMLSLDEPPELTIDAKYLFGAAGADFTIEGEAVLRQMRSIAEFPGYVFGLYDQERSPSYQSFESEMRTDENGHAALYPEYPYIEKVTTPLEVAYYVRVAEGSGRPVERIITAEVAGTDPIIGIKREANDDVFPENSTANFSLIALDAARNPVPMEVHWEVNRVQTRYQWYSSYGQWYWEPVTTRVRVSDGKVMLGDAPVKVSADVKWGEYEIKVERSDGPDSAASDRFYAGWYVSADTASTPDTLELSLDKTQYLPGDTATLRIVPRYAGKALVSVLSDHVIAMQTVDVVEGENTITLPVTDDWGAGAYVTASVIRPMNTASEQNPARALGLSYAKVDPGAAQLKASIEAPAQSDPRGPLPVAVKVDGVQPGETAYVTIAAVDVGILNLTAFDSPDPSAYYFGQRRLGVGLRDVYGRLIDGMSGETGAVRSGGDSSVEAQNNAEPPTEELVAYFQGPIEVGPDGYARTSFDIPSFNGSVRIMAVAWSKTGVGQAETDVIVRDPVVVSASVPRFMAPGDSSRMLLELIHTDGPAGAMQLAVTSDGLTLGAVPATVDLAEGKKVSLSIPVTAGETGRYHLDIALTTPAGKVLTKQLNLSVRDLEPLVARTSRFDIAPGETFTLNDEIFAGLRPGSAKASVAIGLIGRIDAPGLLQALDQYPYGCTEQIASAAMPLLYLDDVAVAMGLEQRDKISQRVEEAVTAILTRQSSSGAFGLWYPDSGDLWLDAYVTDFLSRAKDQGFDVPDIAFRTAIDNLRNQVNYATDFEKGGEDLAYALLVLAREGAAAIGDLRYFADERADAFATPLALAQIGASLAAYGDQTRADRMFKKASDWIIGQEKVETGRYWRSDYGSNLRDSAAVLALAVESGSTAVDRAALTTRITGPRRIDYMSTQESVWSLMAANALIGDAANENITIDGQAVDGPLVRMVDEDTVSQTMAIKNGNDTPTTLTVTAFGSPSEPEPAGGQGYKITRDWYTLEGELVDASEVKVGTRLVAVLQITPLTGDQARLMVNDPLPAGFEIDNPNLLQSGNVRALDFVDFNAYPRMTQFLEERFLAAVDWSGTETFQLAYIVRAVSPGEFHRPAASVEDMYRPAWRARTDAGTIRVTE